MFVGMPGTSIRWLIPALVVAGLVAVPLLAVLASLVLPPGPAWQHVVDTLLAEYVLNSLALMLLTSMLALLWGVPSAWLVAACRFPGRRALSWLLVLPLAAPAYVLAYAYTDLLDVSGPLQTAIRSTLGLGIDEFRIGGVRSLPGAAVLLSLVLYPYVYLLARTSFSTRSGLQFEAARVLGLAPWPAFRRVALPAARPAIAGGIALVLMETLADFGVVEYFGVPVFSTGIFRSWIGLGDKIAAMRLAAVLLLFVALLVLLEQGSRRGAADAGVYRKPAAIRLRGWRAIAATVYCSIPVLFGFVVPMAILIWLKIDSGGDALPASDFVDFLGNSVRVSAAAALVATGLALLLGYVRRLQPGRLSNLLIRFGTLGYALPGMLLAIGLLGPLGTVDRHLTGWLAGAFGYGGGLVLSGTTMLLVYAYVCRFLTVSYNTVQGGFASISPSIDDAARSLGATPGKVIRRVHLPMLAPSIGAATLLVFVDTMRELPATVMLRPFGFETLATRVYRLASDERLAEASTAALCIVLVGILPVLLLNRVSSVQSAE